MAERRLIKFHYTNSNISSAGTGHVFNYLSALGNFRFVEDRDKPDVWGGTSKTIPDSAKVILSKKIDSDQPSFFDEQSTDRKIYLKTDPIERIFRKLSLKTVTGPYGAGDRRPVNDPGESLASITGQFYNQLESAGLSGDGSPGIPLWPNGGRFAVAVTHDVDITKRSLKGSMKLLFKRDVPGGFKGLCDSVLSVVGVSKNPYNGIGDWLDYEGKAGIKSTFFIFSGVRSHPNDPKYGPGEHADFIRLITDTGSDIGLHSGIESLKGDGLRESGEILRKITGAEIKGIRPHYLSAAFPEYWRAASEIGFQFSSSLGFDKEIGFFNGIDLPIVPFDTDADEPLSIVEIPISIMDCGLIGDRGERLSNAIENGKKMIENVKSNGGILVMDWHQRTMYRPDYPGWPEVLFELIDYARNEGACFLTLQEAAGLLKDRMSAVR